MLVSMTTKTTKMLMLTAALTMVIVPGIIYAAGFNEHQTESVSANIGKVADGTFDEKVAQDRLEYLMTDQVETGVSHEKEITAIETEYQKLYQWDFEERQRYEEFSDIVLDNVIMLQTEAGSTSEKHMESLPIIGVNAYAKTKSLEITINENHATEKDLPRIQKFIQGVIGEDVRVNYKFSQPVKLDSHTSNRESLTVDPLKGGASVGFRDGQVQQGCTAGYMATENGSGDEGFVSAGHCTEDAPGYGQTGTNIYQP